MKILASGDLTKKLTVHAHLFSSKAAEKIQQAKGTTVVIPDAAAATAEKSA